MDPVVLRTERLVLSMPTLDDVERVTEYCQDPLFEQYLSTPWPYRRRDAEHFLGEVVPNGWRLGGDLVWALRESDDGALLGVVGLHRRRPAEPDSFDVGYWLGAPHRGHGYMAEAVRAVARWALEYGNHTVYWECALGNLASRATARTAGFTFTGTAPSQVAARDGSHPPYWHGQLRLSTRGADGHANDNDNDNDNAETDTATE